MQPLTNFDKMSPCELADFVFDAFERHSLPYYAGLTELEHAFKMKLHVAMEFNEHGGNKTISKEMWATAVLLYQLGKITDPKTRPPLLLGEEIYENPIFIESFMRVRESHQPMKMSA